MITINAKYAAHTKHYISLACQGLWQLARLVELVYKYLDMLKTAKNSQSSCKIPQLYIF